MPEAKLKATKGTGIKMWTPKQMLQRMSTALTQVKAGNNSENYRMKSDKVFVLCINQKKSQKKYTIT